MPDTKSQKKPRLLLHVCCIGCGAYVAKVLAEEYEVTLFFYNPNIYPEDEYNRRFGETKRVAEELGLPLMIVANGHDSWLSIVKGHEGNHEGGERCKICYKDRLKQTALMAMEKNIKFFTSTLTVSPHKKAEVVNKIGEKIAKKYSLEFLAQDFKKHDGFKKACVLSGELKLYRQNYCGCEFSIRS